MVMLRNKYIVHFSVIFGSFLAISIFSFLLVDHHSTNPDRINRARANLLGNGQSVSDRIKPVGNVSMEETAPQLASNTPAVAAPSVARDATQIYSQSCGACHAAGIAGAPKVGDQAQWKPRIAKGINVLYTSALNGTQGAGGVMPAKGGNAALPDAEIKAVVDYMVAQAK